MAQRDDLGVLGEDLFQIGNFAGAAVRARIPPAQLGPRPCREVDPRPDVGLVARALHHDLVPYRVEHVEARRERGEQLRRRRAEDDFAPRAPRGARPHPGERLDELVRPVHGSVRPVAVRVPRAELNVVVAHVVVHGVRHASRHLRSARVFHERPPVVVGVGQRGKLGSDRVDGEVVPLALRRVVPGVARLRGRRGRTGRGLALGVQRKVSLVHGGVGRGRRSVHGVGGWVSTEMDSRWRGHGAGG